MPIEMTAVVAQLTYLRDIYEARARAAGKAYGASGLTDDEQLRLYGQYSEYARGCTDAINRLEVAGRY